MNQPLFEKYRPRKWGDFVGQDAAIEKVTSIGKRCGFGGRAFWITGLSGSGKTSMARLIAREVADDFFVTEIDASALTNERLKDIDNESRFYAFGKGGRAYIVNEAHGMRSPIILKLLVMLEPIQPHVCWIFTTTEAGRSKLFADMEDAAPFISRCTDIDLDGYQNTDAVAKHAQRVARTEGLDGRPIDEYRRLARESNNNLRMMLGKIEAGCMRKPGIPAKRSRK